MCAYVPRLVSAFSNLCPNWPPECTGSGRGPSSPAGSGPTGRGLGTPRARGVGPRNLQTSQREGRSQHATTGESLLRSDAGPAFVGVCDLLAGPRGSQVRLLRARPRMSPCFSPCSAWPAPGWGVRIAPPPGKWGDSETAGRELREGGGELELKAAPGRALRRAWGTRAPWPFQPPPSNAFSRVFDWEGVSISFSAKFALKKWTEFFFKSLKMLC